MADFAQTWRPNLAQRLGGILSGQTKEEQVLERQAKLAQLASIAKRAGLQDKIFALLSGEGDAAPEQVAPMPASTRTKSFGPVVDEGIAQPEQPVAVSPMLPSARRVDPDRLQRILAAAAYTGDAGATKAAEVISKLRPDLDKGLYTDEQGRVHVREGYTDASRALSGATTAGAEEAKAGFDVIDVDLPDGSKVQMPRGVYIQLQKSGQFPQLGRSQTPGAKVASEEAARAPYDFITTQDAQGRPVTMSKSVAAGQTFVGQDDSDAEYQKKGAVAAADRFKALQDAGNRAPGVISKYRQLDALLGDFEGGKLAPAGLEIASTLNSLGFKMDPKMANVQAADSLAKQITLDALGGSLGTAISNGDREFIDRTQPGLQNSAAGRRTLVQMQIKGLQRQADVAQKARQWQQRFGRIDTPDAFGKTFDDYLAVWADRNPLFAQGKR